MSIIFIKSKLDICWVLYTIGTMLKVSNYFTSQFGIDCIGATEPRPTARAVRKHLQSIKNSRYLAFRNVASLEAWHRLKGRTGCILFQPSLVTCQIFRQIVELWSDFRKLAINCGKCILELAQPASTLCVSVQHPPPVLLLLLPLQICWIVVSNSLT